MIQSFERSVCWLFTCKIFCAIMCTCKIPASVLPMLACSKRKHFCTNILPGQINIYLIIFNYSFRIIMTFLFTWKYRTGLENSGAMTCNIKGHFSHFYLSSTALLPGKGVRCFNCSWGCEVSSRMKNGSKCNYFTFSTLHLFLTLRN